MSNTDSFFESGGSGYPAAKFTNIGDAIAGTITAVSEPFERDDLNGEPQTNVVIEIHTDAGDDVALWVQKPAMKVAIADAVRAAGASGAPQVGGRLGVRHHTTKPSKHKGHNPQKLFEAQYSPPANAAGSDFFNSNATAGQPQAAAEPLI